MKRIITGLAALAALTLVASNASAATASGTLQVTGSVQGSISLSLVSGNVTLTGSGTNSATAALSNISKYGTAPSGFSLARGASNWTLSTNFNVQVDAANLTSTDYTLTAQLQSAAPSGVTFKLNGSSLSDSAATTLTSTGTYGSAAQYDWDIVIADSAAAGSIGNDIDFTATSN